MAVNDLTFNQLSTVLNSIVQQATGQKVQQVTNTAEFVSVAQTALKTGYDPVLQAVSQVLSRTIFSIRPYTRKFGGLMVSNQQFGNIVRKLNIADKDWENDSRFELTDGSGVDMYKVNKPTILQSNFYGANVFEKSLTIFKDQLDCAFSSPDEFGRFVSMTMTNASDMIEQAHENLARATLANFIGGKISGDTASVIHLLTEYNTQTGLSLTSTTVFTPEHYPAFVKWVFSRVNAISSMMTEYSINYHTNVTDGMFVQSTPKANQKLFISAPFMYDTTARVLADTYHDNMLTMSTTEIVNFWQDIDNPLSLKMTPTILNADGTIAAHSSPITTDKLFGVIMDEEAAGYTIVNYRTRTIYNPKGEYTNIFWKFTDRYWNDFTENAVVLLLD